MEIRRHRSLPAAPPFSERSTASCAYLADEPADSAHKNRSMAPLLFHNWVYVPSQSPVSMRETLPLLVGETKSKGLPAEANKPSRNEGSQKPPRRSEAQCQEAVRRGTLMGGADAGWFRTADQLSWCAENL